MPAWLVWLCPVPLATVGAILWTSWATRTRRPVATNDSVVAYERFRLALTRPAPVLPPSAPVPGPRTGSPSVSPLPAGRR